MVAESHDFGCGDAVIPQEVRAELAAAIEGKSAHIPGYLLSMSPAGRHAMGVAICTQLALRLGVPSTHDVRLCAGDHNYAAHVGLASVLGDPRAHTEPPCLMVWPSGAISEVWRGAARDLEELKVARTADVKVAPARCMTPADICANQSAWCIVMALAEYGPGLEVARFPSHEPYQTMIADASAFTFPLRSIPFEQYDVVVIRLGQSISIPGAGLTAVVSKKELWRSYRRYMQRHLLDLPRSADYTNLTVVELCCALTMLRWIDRSDPHTLLGTLRSGAESLRAFILGLPSLFSMAPHHAASENAVTFRVIDSRNAAPLSRSLAQAGIRGLIEDGPVFCVPLPVGVSPRSISALVEALDTFRQDIGVEQSSAA